MFLENPMLKVYVFRDEMEQSYIVVVTGGKAKHSSCGRRRAI